MAQSVNALRSEFRRWAGYLRSQGGPRDSRRGPVPVLIVTPRCGVPWDGEMRRIDREVTLVPATSGWALTPRQSIEIECARRGRDQVIDGCVALLGGRDADDDLILALAGPAGLVMIHDGPAQRNQYWGRVWGARGLLYAFDERAADAVIGALRDEHWRVREMAAKVIARHKLGAALPAIAELRDDPVPRVRAASKRALVILTAAAS
jgi:hypothetical protein